MCVVCAAAGSVWHTDARGCGSINLMHELSCCTRLPYSLKRGISLLTAGEPPQFAGWRNAPERVARGHTLGGGEASPVVRLGPRSPPRARSTSQRSGVWLRNRAAPAAGGPPAERAAPPLRGRASAAHTPNRCPHAQSISAPLSPARSAMRPCPPRDPSACPASPPPASSGLSVCSSTDHGSSPLASSTRLRADRREAEAQCSFPRLTESGRMMGDRSSCDADAPGIKCNSWLS
mmetsp:Transcript_30775/g.99564  ORF Transcript_30775/g.99564 Transcript_30775/m.99564 type:complete len:234 (+) Transcript_30775:149-850(+)